MSFIHILICKKILLSILDAKCHLCSSSELNRGTSSDSLHENSVNISQMDDKTVQYYLCFIQQIK